LVGLDVSCPKGWGFYDPNLELSEYFCPRCDVAFLMLEDDLSPGGGIQDLRWKREDGELIPCQPEEEGLIKFNKKMWEVRKTLLFYHVAEFVYWRSRPYSAMSCRNDGATIPVIGLIPYQPGSWIALGWCSWCKVGFGMLSDALYGWSDALTFWYDADERSYRVSPMNDARWPCRGVELIVGRVEDRLNELIVADRHGVPAHVSSEAGQMEIGEVPHPGYLPASLWDGWMTGFKPGVLTGKRRWRE
jgi:hypothetical protein